MTVCTRRVEKKGLDNSAYIMPSGMALVKEALIAARPGPRIVIVDDSLSTQKEGRNGVTRWETIKTYCKQIVALALETAVPVGVIRLNVPGIVYVVHEDGRHDVNHLLTPGPRGGTPLIKCLKDLTIPPDCTIIILTDGCADGNLEDFIDTIRGFTSRGAQFIVALVTEDENVIDYYNEAEKEEELNIDVIRSFDGERKEVAGFNPWINYTEELHICRIFGGPFELSEIDSRKLTLTEKARVVNWIGENPIESSWGDCLFASLVLMCAYAVFVWY